MKKALPGQRFLLGTGAVQPTHFRAFVVFGPVCIAVADTCGAASVSRRILFIPTVATALILFPLMPAWPASEPLSRLSAPALACGLP